MKNKFKKIQKFIIKYYVKNYQKNTMVYIFHNTIVNYVLLNQKAILQNKQMRINKVSCFPILMRKYGEIAFKCSYYEILL